MPLDLTDDKSTLIQVMAWCHQATGHYLSQCWPRSMSPYDVTRPQWVKPFYHLTETLKCWPTRTLGLAWGWLNVLMTSCWMNFRPDCLEIFLAMIHINSLTLPGFHVKNVVLKSFKNVILKYIFMFSIRKKWNCKQVDVFLSQDFKDDESKQDQSLAFSSGNSLVPSGNKLLLYQGWF